MVINTSQYRTLYPEIEARETRRLKVSDVHELYVEAAGNPEGVPVVFLHGGPGGGIEPKHRRYFDPARYNIILFDQRGSGQSTPHAHLEENTTWDLVRDIETIREAFGIDKWVVFGGSWGSTLSLAYAETHPDRVLGLVLRGIFLCRREEIQWFYQQGCNQILPDRYETFQAQIPEAERHDMVTAYYKRLTDPNPDVALKAAKAWSGYEGSACKLIPDLSVISDFESDKMALAIARIECHYFVNGCFFESDNQLLENAFRLKDIPTWIVHGRYDVVCPPKNAWDLKKAMPHAQLNIVADAGHSAGEPGITHGLLEATDAMAAHLAQTTLV